VQKTKTVVKNIRRHECEECGKPAKYRYTYLLEGMRNNPASAAYGHDDCSYCEDGDPIFRCGPCGRPCTPSGYVDASRYEYGEKWEHLFNYWDEVEVKP